jgi:nicotinate-nucleotide adenylyltransferase
MKTGVCGGTFDPIHFGHMIIGSEASDILGLKRILYIPAKNPPHKSNALITEATHRMKMLRIALSDNSLFKISDMEIRRSGLSYTVRTMEQLTAENPDDEFYFLMGQDAFAEIETWHRYQELFDLCRVVVVTRPDSPDIKSIHYSGAIKDILEKKAIYCKSSLCRRRHFDDRWRVCFMDIPLLSISGSDIRTRVKHNRSIRYLLPARVIEYIYMNKLYKD